MKRIYPLMLLFILVNTFNSSCGQKSSLTFVIDDTSSMWDNIDQVKISAEKLTNIVFDEKSSVIENMVLVTVNDPNSHLITVTKDRDDLKNKINSLYAHNEDNKWCEEPSLQGIILALKHSLPGSYVYVFTDADASDYLRSAEVKKLCQQKQTQIVFVLTGFCYSFSSPGFQVFYDIADACSGLAFFVPSRKINQIMDVVRLTTAGNKAVLKSGTTPPNVYTDVHFTIDEQTEYAIVSAAGYNVELRINGPYSEQIIKMWNSNGKVIHILNPTPGEYVATVNGETKTSITIVGITNFLFTHGFSELEPKSQSDTSPQPIADTKVYLSINVTDEKQLVQITTAEILDNNDRNVGILTLHKISKNFYITRRFIAPSFVFKIAVNGIVKETNKPIRRLSKIPITPQIPEKKPDSMAPTITIVEGKTVSVEYDSKVKLTCKVKAYPKPEITWTNSKGIKMISTSSLIQDPYDYISYLELPRVVKGETFFCTAINTLNINRGVIKVDVKSPFKVISIPKGITNVSYGTESIIPCDVRSSKDQLIKWYFTDKSTGKRKVIVNSEKYDISAAGKHLKIKKMDLDLVGKYTCEINLIEDIDQKIKFDTKVQIDGLAAPAIISKTSVVSGIVGDVAMRIPCEVTGVPKPNISWKFNNVDIIADSKYLIEENALVIVRPNLRDTGAYTCVAKNVIASSNATIQAKVEAAPAIISKTSVVSGVVGDVAMRIPCEVTGVPKPNVSWKFNNVDIIADSKYLIEENALVVVRPNLRDTGAYTCVAKNFIASCNATIQAKVEESIDSLGTVKHFYVAKGETKMLHCEAQKSASQSVEWFIEPKRLKSNKPHVFINNASIDSEGNYTCRVSDIHGYTQTLTYEVIVGDPPTFFELISINNWDGNVDDIIAQCRTQTTRIELEPTIEWTVNGKKLTGMDSKEASKYFTWGHYTCNVSNPLGSVQRSFEVQSFDCLINRNTEESQYNMPLLLTEQYNWPSWKSTKNYIIIKQSDKFIMSCPTNKNVPNTLKLFPTHNNTEIKCIQRDTFEVKGDVYKLADLRCTESITPTLKTTKTKCLSETSELIRVGFEVEGFLETYEVCFDKAINMPIYSRVLMSSTESDNGVAYKWNTYPSIGDKNNVQGITCNNIKTFDCYEKMQLISAQDLNYGSAKNTTFIEPLNSFPYWIRSQNNKPLNVWHNIEDMIRNELNNYDQFVVWSGTHTVQKKNGAIIPRYLWKVVRLDEDDVQVIVHVNDPSPTDNDFKCSTNYSDDYDCLYADQKATYCCSLEEFFEAFDLGGTDVGEPLSAALEKIQKRT